MSPLLKTSPGGGEAPSASTTLHRSVVIKKYSNRRLYDTQTSGYVTLEEVADRVRGGEDVRVVDAKTGADLTQVTLTSIILESRGAAKLLPVALLYRLIRMEEDALAEFFGVYLSGALEVYLTAKKSARAMLPYNPFLTLAQMGAQVGARVAPLIPGLAPYVGGWPDGRWQGGPVYPAAPHAPPASDRRRAEPAEDEEDEEAPGLVNEQAELEAAQAEQAGEIAALRKELDALKAAVHRAHAEEPKPEGPEAGPKRGSRRKAPASRQGKR